jgi:outer membrane protein assembly factor BamE
MRYDPPARIIPQMTNLIDLGSPQPPCRCSLPARATAAAMRASLAAHMRRGGVLLLACALLAACVYRMPIRQGNYLDPAAIAQVKPGMTHSQVRYVLGTPMVPESFDNGRWDYDYYLNEHRLGKPHRAHVTVYFANDVVSRVVSDVKVAPVTAVTRRGRPVPNAF